MRHIHLRSYLTGLATGVIMLLLFVSLKSVFTSSPASEAEQRGQFLQGDTNALGRGIMDTERLQNMAEQFGMTLTELQAEMEAGKTLPEIAEERGVDFSRGMMRRGEVPQGTGAVRVPDAPLDSSEDSVSDI